MLYLLWLSTDGRNAGNLNFVNHLHFHFLISSSNPIGSIHISSFSQCSLKKKYLHHLRFASNYFLGSVANELEAKFLLNSILQFADHPPVTCFAIRKKSSFIKRFRLFPIIFFKIIVLKKISGQRKKNKSKSIRTA